MTSPEDDLRGLINELDELHGPGPEGEAGYCAECNCFNAEGSGADCRPCPCSTMQIVDKYKRRAHRRRYIVAASPDRNFAWGTGQPPTEYSVTIKPAGNTVHRAATPDQCHAWIEQQYEENK